MSNLWQEDGEDDDAETSECLSSAARQVSEVSSVPRYYQVEMKNISVGNHKDNSQERISSARQDM